MSPGTANFGECDAYDYDAGELMCTMEGNISKITEPAKGQFTCYSIVYKVSAVLYYRSR